MNRVKPVPGLAIREDTAFEPGTWVFEDGQGITVEADDIVVDGRGAVLQSRATTPDLPGGDFLYSPGSLGLAREVHELVARRVSVPGAGELAFEYRYWGSRPDPATVALSSDRREWTSFPSAPVTDAETGSRPGSGWLGRRFPLGARDKGELSLRLSVPADALDPAAPIFYDAFRVLLSGAPIWEGDARGHWQNWYNTGFTIFKRSSRAFFAGTAVRAEGRRGVTLRNLTARGFLTGIHLSGCTACTLEGNDLSDNFDDADYGWGEGSERFAALFLDRVSRSTVQRNRGTRVWNGIVMRRCEENVIERNDFSHCSNTCLKMAQSSRNLVRGNILSWGLRIYPGEVHARDSVSLLLESGSNDNRFVGNDFTHGGDGIFVRVLDHWCSTGNLFEGNDCSHANNNAVESWSPGNTYVRNRANWSSYGFWLGGSDDTVLRDNEVMHNGRAFQNAPEPFGNAGISVVHGASTGFVVTGNRVLNNAGPGMSVGYKEGSPARLWLVAGNEIRGNSDDPRGYEGRGIFLEHCEDIVIGKNTIEGNGGRSIVLGRSCRHVTVSPRIAQVLEGLSIRVGAPVVTGKMVQLSVSGNGGTAGSFPGNGSMRLDWDFGDGARETRREHVVTHAWSRPGRYRLSVTAIGRTAAGMATRTVFVLPTGMAIADFGDAARWELATPGAGEGLLAAFKEGAPGGGAYLRAVVRSGTRSILARHLAAPLDLSVSSGVSFWYRYSCDLSILAGRGTRTVGLRIHAPGGSLELIPDTPFRGEPSEDRYDWVFFSAPRASMRSTGTPDLRSVTRVELIFGPDAPADCIFCAADLTAGSG